MTDEQATAHAFKAVHKALKAYAVTGASPLEASRHMCVVTVALMLVAAGDDPRAKLEELLGLMGHIQTLAAELEAAPQGARLN